MLRCRPDFVVVIAAGAVEEGGSILAYNLATPFLKSLDIESLKIVILIYKLLLVTYRVCLVTELLKMIKPRLLVTRSKL